jgi:hypothetical protein
MIKNLLALLLLVPFLANSEPPSGDTLILHYGDHCHFIKVNEAEYKLEWGKDSTRNISFSTFDTSEIARCALVAETDEFAVLKISGGTGNKKSIILPLNSKSREIQYQNAICVDLEDTTILLENPSKDSVLVVENFINKKKVVLGKGFIPCRSVSVHDCIDSLVMYKNELMFRWITPCKQCKDRKGERKKFRIDLRG